MERSGGAHRPRRRQQRRRDWKQRGDLTYMLEHVARPYAERYLARIRADFGLPDATISALCAVNDARGGADVQDFGGARAACASLRYLFHALVITARFSATRVVEVGGGYGGLALMIAAVARWRGAPVRAYRIYDLPAPVALQRAYLTTGVGADAMQGVELSWGAATTCGGDYATAAAAARDDAVLVSTYAVSELAPPVCDAYLAALVPHCGHAFLAWSVARRSPALPSTRQEEVEDPPTGPHNVIITY